MTHYERIHLAMEHKEPDRIPVMCQLSQGYMAINGKEKPFDMYFNPESAARAFFTTREELSFDGILLNTSFEEGWEDIYENTRIEQIPGGERYLLPDGRVLEDQNGQLMTVQDPGRTAALADIEELEPEEVPLRLDYSSGMVLHKLAVAEGRREAFSVHGEIVSPFDCLCVLLGLENAMMAMITDGEKCEAILARYVEQCMAFAKAQIDVGVDTMKISSPFAGGSFISKEFYARFVVPFEREVVKRIHVYAPGVPVYTHTCGFIGDRLELMAETGIDGIECMDPPPLGNTELKDAKERVGDRLFLKGNMDSVNVLLGASPKRLEEYVGEMIRAGMQGGGYILSSACSVAPGVRPEVLKLLVPLAEKYGSYGQGK
ncbi:MAG: hypothetical protein HFI42_13140 [Lachnospiraceae bacterium]|nr:hypothetical protein [Lachnospiraceae bacterium]